MGNYEVEYFMKTDGTYPAEEFILAQNIKMCAKQGNNITRVLYL